MTARIATLVTAAVAALLVLFAVLALVPEERDIAVQVYVVFLAAMIVIWLIARARAAHPTRASTFDEARRPHKVHLDRLPELGRIEREVALGTSNAFDLHYRLRPRIRDVAAHRLATRRGIDLAAQPQAARAALAEPLWELVRPDREPPRNRFAAGISRDQLRAVVDALDTI